ncbi:hypothetical protein C5S31_02880, partial [ANME-1 cluster archaeon GoMg2]|nr:hypothetical protein [ANME-1 cluster archaeon GoMg2]
ILTGMVTGVFADTPTNTAMAKPILPDNYLNNHCLLTEKDISLSSDHIQKGREFTIYVTLRNPYNSTITGNLSLLVPSYFKVEEAKNKPFTLEPHSNKTLFFKARPLLFRQGIGPTNLITTSVIGAPPGKGKLYFNINYTYNDESKSKSDTCPFEIKVVSAYISLFIAAAFGGILGSFLKELTKGKNKVGILKWRPLLWGFLAAILVISIQPLGESSTHQGAILLGAGIGYLGSSIVDDIIGKGR